MGENSWSSSFISFIFTCHVKPVPVHDFKPVQVVLHPSVKEFPKQFIDKSKLYKKSGLFRTSKSGQNLTISRKSFIKLQNRNIFPISNFYKF